MKDVEKAIEMMLDLTYYVNEVKRDRESLDTINMIEQSIEDLSMVSLYWYIIISYVSIYNI